jgi:hypothetical protein
MRDQLATAVVNGDPVNTVCMDHDKFGMTSLLMWATAVWRMLQLDSEAKFL